MNTQEISLQERIARMRKGNTVEPNTIERAMEQPVRRPIQPLKIVKVEKKFDMKEASIQLDYGFKELFKLLRESGHFVKIGKSNLPCSELIAKGFFINELKKFKRGHVENQYTKTYVTASGMSFLGELIAKEKSKNDEKKLNACQND